MEAEAMIEMVQATFDYASLDSDTRVFVQEKAQSIHARLKRTAEDVIAIGQDLIEVKARLGHGKFGTWLDTEFEMSYPTAVNFMRVAERFGKSITVIDLPLKVLYELAAPSTPETVIEMVESGTISPTLAAIREAKQEVCVQHVYPEPSFGPNWNHVNGAPFTAPLPDGKPIEIPEDWKLPPSLRNVDNIPLAVPHISSKNNEWYTPEKYIDAARELMGGIDLDPASCKLANETVKAARYYDITQNGLDKDWKGLVWLNPPYGRSEDGSNQALWSQRLIQQYKAGITKEAILLVNAAVDTIWFQELFDYPVCLTLGRINFTTPDPVASGSTHGSAFVYFGPQPERFFEIFSEFGTVVRRW